MEKERIVMARPKLYQCPSCNQRFTSQEVIDGVCPHCKQPLKAEQHKIGVRIVTEYVAATTKHQPTPALKPIAEELPGYGEVISNRGEMPVIYLKLKQREYTMLYYGSGQIVNWVYCPSCAQKLFQNIVVSAAHVEQKHVCRKCKARVNVVFTRDKPNTT